MDEHTLNLLEFHKILRELSGYCFSSEGIKRIRSQRIQTDPLKIQEILDLVGALRSVLESTENTPQFVFPKVRKSIQALGRPGTVLDPEELAAIGSHQRRDHVILIDDARCFDGTNDYPSLERVVSILKQVNSQYCVRVWDDIIQAYPCDSHGI